MMEDIQTRGALNFCCSALDGVGRNLDQMFGATCGNEGADRVLFSPLGKEVIRNIKLLRCGNRAEVLKGVKRLADISFYERVPLPDVVDEFLSLLRMHPSVEVRAEVAWSLWKFRDSRAELPLVKVLLTDRAIVVREMAARSLGLMKSQYAFGLLLKTLLDDRVPVSIRAGAAAGLGSYNRQDALFALAKVVDDASPLLRIAVVRSLEVIASWLDEVEAAFLRRLLKRRLSWRSEQSAKVREHAARALRVVVDSRVASLLCCSVERDPDVEVRAVVASALCGVDGINVEASLISAMDDEWWTVRKNAAISLARNVCQFGGYDRYRLIECFTKLERLFPTNLVVWSEVDRALEQL